MTYNLDVMGNRTSVVDGSGTKNYTTVNRNNLLTQAGTTQYTHDSLGDTIAKSGGYEYRYDEENRLRQVLLSGQVIARCWYDAGGNRVRTDEGGTITYYTYDGLNTIQEDNYNTGVRTDYIFAGSTRVAEKKAGVVRYFHGDHLGSSRVVTDQSGGEAARYKYGPFGATISHSGSDVRYKFTGKPQDGTGLYYFGARYYDPEVGRFTTVDPIGSGHNHFVYCANNPLRYIDPTGLYDPDDPNAPANKPNPNTDNGYHEEEVPWTYPLESESDADPATGARYFGAPRAGGRVHAGMDLIADPDTKVLSMTDGIVIGVYYFYSGTYAVEVRNADGTIVRYGEICASVKAGDVVAQGDAIGAVIANDTQQHSSMLHIELYMGTSSGSLTDRNNSSNYDYVAPANYQRRSDLMNPMWISDLDLYVAPSSYQRVTPIA